MKKSYNPFKMWGSYIGAYILPAITVLFVNYPNVTFVNLITLGIFGIHSISELSPFLFVVLVGFLLGYAIHSLVRYLRR